MASGRPTKWATATISEPIAMGKAGIEIVIFSKYKTTRRLGTAIITVGGIRWKPYMAKKTYRISWDKLSEMSE